MKKTIKTILLFIILFFLISFVFLFVGSYKPKDDMVWGVDFSYKQADFLGLDPKETYLEILDDLGAKNVKISAHWDLIEKDDNNYDFSFLDWQMKEAEKRNVSVILAIGMKTPRWPECHLPYWARDLDKETRQDKVLEMLKQLVMRYKDSPSLYAWQVENEPFLKFGACPALDEKFFRQEIAFVKKMDPSKPILVTDTGELSLWTWIATYGDIIGVTTYTRVWQEQFNFYFDYPDIAVSYGRRASLIKAFMHKKVIGVELQAEPWCSNSIINASREEQDRTMSFERFKYNISYAKKTGLDTFYFWGAEWWYFMKIKHNDDRFWQEAKNLFQ